MTDEDHIRYMLDGGERGRIERPVETKDAWGFGGTLWLAKEHPAFKDGPMTEPSGTITQLNSHCRFETTRFELADAGAKGFAVWFVRGFRDTSSSSLDNRSLCGWVRLEREAEFAGWIDFLNDLIAKHLAKLQAAWEAMTDEERRDAMSHQHFEASMAFFRRLGVPTPEAQNMDEFMTRLEAMASADSPVDLRSREPVGSGSPPDRDLRGK